jgi:hypothetical protein
MFPGISTILTVLTCIGAALIDDIIIGEVPARPGEEAGDVSMANS